MDPTRWTEELTASDGALLAVDGSADAGLWVAARGLYHLQGGTWSPVEGTGDRQWRALAIAGPGDLWAAGAGGSVLHGDGQTWTASALPGVVGEVTQIEAAGGRAWASAAGDELWSWDGQAWTATTPPELAGRYIGGLHAASADLLFAQVPEKSTGKPLALARRAGGAWTVDVLGRGWRYAASIEGSGPSDVWAVGMKGKLFGKGGFAVHFDGRSWSDVPIPVDLPLTDVSVRGPDEAWAVGWKGTLLRWDGHTWSVLATGSRRPFTRIHAGDDGVRVIEDDHTLLRWTGGEG